MTPMYFPFTYIPGSVCGALLSCFEKIAVLHPAGGFLPSSWSGEKIEERIEILRPHLSGTNKLPKLLGEYRSWADLHRGERPDLHKFFRRSPPVGEDSISGIRRQIRDGASEKKKNSAFGNDAAQSLLNARLLLAFAHQYDQEQDQLLDELRRIDALERSLFRDLSPESESGLASGSGMDTRNSGTAAPMPDERLSAWARLYLHHLPVRSAEDAPTTALFITSEDDIFSRLLAKSTDPEQICTVTGIPLSEASPQASAPPSLFQKIETDLQKISRGSACPAPSQIRYADPGACHDETADLTIYRTTGNPLSDLIPGVGLYGEPTSLSARSSAGHYFFASLTKNLDA